MYEKIRRHVFRITGEIISGCERIILTIKKEQEAAEYKGEEGMVACYKNDTERIKLLIDTMHALRHDATAEGRWETAVLLLKYSIKHAREALIIPFEIDLQRKLLRKFENLRELVIRHGIPQE